jgi:CrcB protein
MFARWGMDWLQVALGGAVGSVARHAIGLALAGLAPLGTLAVNLLGCALIGWLHGRLGQVAPERLLLMTGFCGGFTTWSAFGLETIRLGNEGRVGAAAAYAAVTVVLCLAAVAAGWALAR